MSKNDPPICVDAEQLLCDTLPADGIAEAMRALAAAYQAVKRADWQSASPIDRMNADALSVLIHEKIQ